MTDSSFDRVREIFAAAIKLSGQQRECFLEEVCGDDASLRREVCALLASDEDPLPELRTPALGHTGVEIDSRGQVRRKDAIARVGSTIAPYHLVEELGEGGFGIVFAAEQAQPVQRLVALKIIKLGMDTEQVIARFEAERQALARMSHPNIAAVLDAGATETGRPYFVMELVRGVPITNYCDRVALTLKRRLRLFCDVCGAVQHAHQKGVIHRDLKPGNVLVAEEQGEPVPKVIDFGIAKATDVRLTEATMFTVMGQLIGTPAYMSPEQADASTVDIDTRADVYSLGALLYELVTGTTPFDVETLRNVPLSEIQRLIREVDPPKPSTRLSASGNAGRTIDRGRQGEVRRLPSTLRSDLDWIIMKALEKDRSRRYETAAAFAEDIRRFLDNEPVIACPPSATYRLRKMMHRHRATVAAVVIIAVLLVGGLTGTSLGLIRALRAERQAKRAERQARSETERARIETKTAETVSRLLRNALEGVGPSVALGRDTALLAEIMQQTESRIEDELRDEPEVEVALRDSIGKVYFEIAEYEKAEVNERRILALLERQFAGESNEVADQIATIAILREKQGHPSDAERGLRQALAIYEHLGVQADREKDADTMRDLGNLLAYTDRVDEAEVLLRRAIKRHRQVLGNTHEKVAADLNCLANTVRMRGDESQAEGLYREALAIHRAALGPHHPIVANDLVNLGRLLSQMGAVNEAEESIRAGVEIQRFVLGEHEDLATSLAALGQVVAKDGRLEEAEVLVREAVGMTRRVVGDVHPTVARILDGLAELLNTKGDLAGALTLREEILGIERNVYGPLSGQVANSTANLAYSLCELDRFDEGEAMHRKALALFASIDPDGSPDYADALNRLGRCLRSAGQLDEAISVFRQALAMRRRVYDGPHPRIANTLNDLSSAYAKLGDYDASAEAAEQSVEVYTALMGADHLYTVVTRANLAAVWIAQGEPEQAESVLRETIPVFIERFGESHRRTMVLRLELGRALVAMSRWNEAEKELRIVDSGGPEQVSTAMRASVEMGLGQVLKARLQFAEAERRLRKAYEIRADHYGEENRQTLDCASELASLYNAWHAQQPDAGHDVEAVKWSTMRPAGNRKVDDQESMGVSAPR